MLIYGLEMSVDVAEVLAACGIRNYRDKGREIVAHCPNHSERTPSWGINKETGQHNCFGCGYSGDVVTLLRDYCPDTPDDIKALRWLHERFPVRTDERKGLDIDHLLDRDRSNDLVLPDSILDAYDMRHPYLYERGFDEPVLQAFRIGWTVEDTFKNDAGESVHVHRAITIPWRDRKGRLRMVQYRQLQGLKYINRGEKRRKLLFGIDWVVRRGYKRVALTEGFADALSFWQAGIPSVAMGSAFITQEQVRELQLSGVRRVDLCMDNPALDNAGKNAREHAVKVLGPYFRLSDMVYPRDVKDPNSLSTDELKELSYTFL